MDIIEAVRIFQGAGRVVVGGDPGILREYDPSTGIALVEVTPLTGSRTRMVQLHVTYIHPPAEAALTGHRQGLRRSMRRLIHHRA
jgi:hypothetical protein